MGRTHFSRLISPINLYMPKKAHSKRHRRAKSEKRDRKLRQKQHQNVYVNVGKGGSSSNNPVPPIVISPPDQSQAFSALFSSLDKRLASIATPYRVSSQLGMEQPTVQHHQPVMHDVKATPESAPIIADNKAEIALKETFGTEAGLNLGAPNPINKGFAPMGDDPMQSKDFFTGKSEEVMNKLNEMDKMQKKQLKKFSMTTESPKPLSASDKYKLTLGEEINIKLKNINKPPLTEKEILRKSKGDLKNIRDSL